MKEDKLEQFLSQNRSEFDSESPPPMVWMRIEKELSTNRKKETLVHELKKTSLIRVMQVAVMFVVVMGVGLMVGMQINNGGNKYNNPHLKEFVEAERHYNRQIDNMWVTVKANGIENDDIEKDLASLDEVYLELKEELLHGKGSNTDEVVNSMIKNYRTKIDILETVLNKTKQSNQQLNIEDGKVEM